MERRTFLGVAAAFLGLRRSAAPTRPMRSKPYMTQEHPEYEEPEGPMVYPILPSQIEVVRCGSGVVVLDGYNLGDNGDRWAHWRYIELEGVT